VWPESRHSKPGQHQGHESHDVWLLDCGDQGHCKKRRPELVQASPRVSRVRVSLLTNRKSAGMRRSLAQQECLGVQPCACATCQLIAGTGETLHYPHGSRPRAPSPSRRAYVYVLSARTPNKEARLHLARLLPDRAETIRTNQLRSCMRSAATQHTSLPTRYMRWALATGKRRTIRGR